MQLDAHQLNFLPVSGVLSPESNHREVFCFPIMKKEHMDNAQCSCPDCINDQSIMFMHPSCHVESPMWVAYNKLTEHLEITCAECGKLVAAIHIPDLAGN